ncbi:MAG: sulfatase-like hydrolase/transferase [Actinomycetia bacterium]|nr:sulfatase-like hydrolase/transferase [Actinomycetes bacterium]
MTTRPDIVILMTDQERAAPPYETEELREWRHQSLPGARWFDEHGVSFHRHYTGSLACVPSRPTLFTGHYPDVHGVTQTNGLGKMADDTRMRWMRPCEVPTIGNWFRAAGYDTHYDGKWHITHSDLTDPETGGRLETNDDEGLVDQAAVDSYLEAEPLEPFGFSGWVGPEPHGGRLADSGYVRDPLIADRVIAWLDDRYARRRAGDADAQRPFLLVASFINPHDIVLFPAWARRGGPLGTEAHEVPPVPPAPTADEDLSTKPAAQIAYRASYPSCYGPPAMVLRSYQKKAEEYRKLYYQLHAEVDGPLDRVRRAVTDAESAPTLLVRTADHGDLLGAHGGLHQKWFNLYDEATRVPFSIARTGNRATTGGRVETAPTSHVDLVPTLLAAASIDEAETAKTLGEQFSEVHPLPGRNLMPVVDQPGKVDTGRPVYLMTRDNMPEGDSGASGLAHQLGRADKPPAPLRILVPAHVSANFEGLVLWVDETETPGGQGHVWKIVRTFDDPDTWTEPGVRHLAATGAGGATYRDMPLPDQWELYDLDSDPIEVNNRWADPDSAAVFALLSERLATERVRCVPSRNHPWPYATHQPTGGPVTAKAPPPVRVLRKGLQRLGLHPEDDQSVDVDLTGCRALVIATNHGQLDIGKPTGVFASEMTVPYYAFLDAGMEVDVASPQGGVIPVDPQSVKSVVRTGADDRFLADERFRLQVTESLAIGDLDMADYDIVYLAGGWGAAFDLGTSEAVAAKITEANAIGKVIGGVCHGPLGLVGATGTDGEPLVKGRHVTAVTDKQVRELGIESTPQHPEAELRKVGADFESATRFRDPLANHWVVDGNLVTGQNQNAAPMVAREMMELVAASSEKEQ